MTEVKGVVVDGLTVGKAVLGVPKLRASAPIQRVYFYENQARKLRKENSALRDCIRWFLRNLNFAAYDAERGVIMVGRDEIVSELHRMGVKDIE